MKMYSIKKSKTRGVWILWCDVTNKHGFGCCNIHEERTKRDMMEYVRDNNIKLNTWINK